MQYTPNPPRVWSRVQNQCNYTKDNTYTSVFIPLTNKTVPLTIANYQERQLYKGNILQYKKNSSNLTKNQKFAQISKGCWANRTKTFATQSQTYSNPNTTGLQRVNYTTFPYPNNIVGAPNNVSGPFQYNVPNPDDCSSNSVQSGGSLICNKYANPCTGEIIKQTQTITCYPTSCSDVPGQIQDLCWDNRLQTYYPRQRYFMSNSGSKWPEGYKGFVSAIAPAAPVVVVTNMNSCSVTLSWTDSSNNNACTPISTYKIYVLLSNVLIKVLTVSYMVTTTTIYGLNYNTTYSFYVAAFSTAVSSNPSNTVTALTSTQPSLVAPTNLNVVGTATGWSVSLTWNDSGNNDICIPVTSYNIYIYNSGGSYIRSQSVPAPNTNAIVTGLNYGTSYLFTVDAESDAESTPVNSPESNSVTATTLNTLFAPILEPAVASCYYITLTWTDVSNNNGGAAVDSYLIYQNGTPVETFTVLDTTTDIDLTANIDLSYNTTSNFYVVAKSGTASSPNSNDVSGNTLILTAPILEAPVFSCQSVELTWTEAASCFKDISYNIYQTGNSVATYTASPPATTYTISDLSYGEPYTYQVQAYISQDISSNYSNDVSGNTYTLAPPTDLKAEFSCQSVALTWTKSDNFPCFDIKGYHIEKTGASNQLYNIDGSDNTSAIIDLSYSSSYAFVVYAYESVTVYSADSNDVSGNTYTLAAPVITSLVPSCQAMTVKWSQPEIFSCFTINRYYVVLNPDLIDEKLYPADDSAYTYTITDLSYNTQYSFAVVAWESDTVYSVDSLTQSDSTLPLAVPSLATPTTQCNSIILTWTEAAAACFSTPYYIIQQTGASSTTYNTGVGDLSFNATGLAYGATYTYQVQAYISQDISSNYSTQVQATTVSTVIPSAPHLTTLTISESGATETVTLTWTDTGNNNPCFHVTSYIVFQNGVQCATINGSSTSISNLSTDTQYDFYVTAYSAASGLSSIPSNTLSTLVTPTYWYLDIASDTLKCDYNIQALKVTTQTPMNTYNVQPNNVQPNNAWTLNSSGILTTSYDVVVSKATIQNNTTTTSTTNYWYFTDATKTSICARYPINALSINVP